MTGIREFRARHAQPPSPPAERTSLVPTIATAAVAFTLSAFTVFFWDRISTPTQWIPSLIGAQNANRAPLPSGDRIGRSVTAPLLKLCINKALFNVHPDQDVEAAVLFDVLVSSNTMGRVNAVLGGKPEHTTVELAEKWADVTDCVYRQNSWALCDIDNRALAVQSANTFLRQADQVLAKPASYAATANEVQALRTIRGRVLDTLKIRVKNGALIASDFAPFAPVSVRQALAGVTTADNACAKR